MEPITRTQLAVISRRSLGELNVTFLTVNIKITRFSQKYDTVRPPNEKLTEYKNENLPVPRLNKHKTSWFSNGEIMVMRYTTDQLVSISMLEGCKLGRRIPENQNVSGTTPSNAVTKIFNYFQCKIQIFLKLTAKYRDREKKNLPSSNRSTLRGELPVVG